MRKSIVALLAVCMGVSAFMSTTAFAQELRFGIIAGGNISRIAEESGALYKGQTIGGYDMDANSKNIPLGGGFLGGLAQYYFNDRFYLRAELTYSQQGTKLFYKETQDAYGMTFSRRSNNINLPVLAGFDIVEGKLNVFAGPQFGFCFSGKDYFKDLNSRQPAAPSAKWSNSAFNKFTLGVLAGLEFMITPNMGILARYDVGFLNIFRSTKEPWYGTVILPAYGKNRMLQLGFEYKFE